MAQEMVEKLTTKDSAESKPQEENKGKADKL